MTKIRTTEGQLFVGEFDRLAERVIRETMATGRSGGAAVEEIVQLVDAPEHERARGLAIGVLGRITGGRYNDAADIIEKAERLLHGDVARSPSHVRAFIPILEKTARDALIAPYQQEICTELVRALGEALDSDPGGFPGSGSFGG